MAKLSLLYEFCSDTFMFTQSHLFYFFFPLYSDTLANLHTNKKKITANFGFSEFYSISSSQMQIHPKIFLLLLSLVS